MVDPHGLGEIYNHLLMVRSRLTFSNYIKNKKKQSKTKQKIATRQPEPVTTLLPTCLNSYLRRASETTLCVSTAATVAGSAIIATAPTLGDASVLTVETLSL